MPKLNDLFNRRARLLTERTARESDVGRRLLPEDLQARILEACERERALVLARVDAIDGERAALEEQRAAALAAEAATVEPLPIPAREVVDLFGRVRVIPGREGAGMATPATIAARQRTHALDRRLAALQEERAHRLAELGEILRVQRAAAAGVVNAVLAVTQGWRNKPLLVGLGRTMELELLKAQQGEISDAAGNPLPPEALDAGRAPRLAGSVEELRRAGGG